MSQLQGMRGFFRAVWRLWYTLVIKELVLVILVYRLNVFRLVWGKEVLLFRKNCYL